MNTPGIEQAEGAVRREVVGVFHETDTFFDAVEDLQSSGFDRSHLSVLASKQSLVDRFGDKLSSLRDLSDTTDMPRTAVVEPESVGDAKGALIGLGVFVGAIVAAGSVIASGGVGIAAAAIAAAAAGGAGGIAGASIAFVVGEAHAQDLQSQIDAGGLLLWINIPASPLEKKAIEVLETHGATHVDAYDVPADPADTSKEGQ